MYETNRKFVIALFNKSVHTLLVSGGHYAIMRELMIECVLPFVFTYGIGGSNMNRQTKVSLGDCIQHHVRLLLPQFLKGDDICVLNHMSFRQCPIKVE